jgi:hypothetical protein
VSITFTPTASGILTGTLTVTGSAGTQTAQLTGTGQSPATDTLTPSSLNFNPQTVGTPPSAAQQLTLTMTNTGDQAVQDISMQSSTADFAAANNCGATLAGHASCAIVVSFLPSIVGPDSATLAVSDIITQGSTHTQHVVLTGTGVAPAGVISATPSSLNFGYYAVGRTDPAVQAVTVTNNGSSSITGLQAAITGDFVLQSAPQNPCGSMLPIGASCNIGVAFTPSQVNGRIGSLTITGTNLPTLFIVALSGSGADFSMKVQGSSSAVVAGGESAPPFQIEIDSVNGSEGPVTLACSVVPATASCTIPALATLTGTSSQFATLNFSASQQASVIHHGWKGMNLVLAMLFPMGFLGRRRRNWRPLAMCALLALIFPIGCGVSSSSGSSPPGGGQSISSTQYTVTVTGSMPGLTQTISVNITVE